MRRWTPLRCIKIAMLASVVLFVLIWYTTYVIYTDFNNLDPEFVMELKERYFPEHVNEIEFISYFRTINFLRNFSENGRTTLYLKTTQEFFEENKELFHQREETPYVGPIGPITIYFRKKTDYNDYIICNMAFEEYLNLRNPELQNRIEAVAKKELDFSWFMEFEYDTTKTRITMIPAFSLTILVFISSLVYGTILKIKIIKRRNINEKTS